MHERKAQGMGLCPQRGSRKSPIQRRGTSPVFSFKYHPGAVLYRMLGNLEIGHQSVLNTTVKVLTGFLVHVVNLL